MTREEFWEWLDTCPAKNDLDDWSSGWNVTDDYGEVKVHFWFEEDEEE